MTISESKGRFFLLNESILIDSHNESNRFESRIGMLYSRPSNKQKEPVTNVQCSNRWSLGASDTLHVIPPVIIYVKTGS